MLSGWARAVPPVLALLRWRHPPGERSAQDAISGGPRPKQIKLPVRDPGSIRGAENIVSRVLSSAFADSAHLVWAGQYRSVGTYGVVGTPVELLTEGASTGTSTWNDTGRTTCCPRPRSSRVSEEAIRQ